MFKAMKVAKISHLSFPLTRTDEGLVMGLKEALFENKTKTKSLSSVEDESKASLHVKSLLH